MQPLHHQHGEARAWKVTKAQELYDIGMPHGGEEATLVVVLGHHALGALVPGVDEGVVEFLPCADQSVHFQLLHGPVGAFAQLPTGRPHVGEDERVKLRSGL